MGFLTTLTLYNDDIDLIKKHPVEFAQACYEACISDKASSIFSQSALVHHQKPIHANDSTIYVHMGNTVTEMNPYSNHTEYILKSHPKFFEDMLKHMESSVKELKKQLKDNKQQNNK